MSERERIEKVDVWLKRVYDAKQYEAGRRNLTDDEREAIDGIVNEYKSVISKIPLGAGRAFIDERCLFGATVKEILITQQISKTKYYQEVNKAKHEIYNILQLE